MAKHILSFLILVIVSIFEANGQEKCATIFNPSNLSRKQLDKLELFNNRVQAIHQSQLNRSKNAPQKSELLLDHEDIILIPVDVHILWNNATENLSQAQIHSQIDILNEDFRRMYSDAINTPVLFQDVAADAQIQFYLACEDPNGSPTSGITRTQTNNTSFSIVTNPNGSVNEQSTGIKFDNTGGKTAWNTAKYLNVWVCDIGGGTLGYAQFPEEYVSKPSTDGVVIDYAAFGENSQLTGYDLGRIATHEIGHWAGLYHIWGKTGGPGNASCGGTDEVSDTPNQADANSGCPSYPESSCGNISDTFMNYMDYTNNACMNLFTNG